MLTGHGEVQTDSDRFTVVVQHDWRPITYQELAEIMTLPENEPVRSWRRIPLTAGPHWFTSGLEERDEAIFVRVSQHEPAGEQPFFVRGYSYDKPITGDEGWWLPIPDERRTAPVEDTTSAPAPTAPPPAP